MSHAESESAGHPGGEPIRFTDRELDVMNVLWSRGDATVTEVREELADTLAYTTVLTVLRILEEKGYVTHREEGRAYRYFPTVAREAAGRSAVSRLVEGLFSGSPELLMTELVSERELPQDTLRRIRKLLDERLGEAGAPETDRPADGEGGGS